MATSGPKMVEIRDRSDEELAISLDRARDELFRLKLNRTTNQLENVMQIRHKRREVAKILTVLTARKSGREAMPTSRSAARATSNDAPENKE